MAFLMQVDFVYRYIDTKFSEKEEVRTMMKTLKLDFVKSVSDLQHNHSVNLITDLKKLVHRKLPNSELEVIPRKITYKDVQENTIHEYTQMYVTLIIGKKDYVFLDIVLPDLERDAMPEVSETIYIAYDETKQLAAYLKWKRRMFLPLMGYAPTFKNNVPK